MKIYGPYVHATGDLRGRKYVCIETEDGKRTTKLYSRYLMEQKLGRELLYEEAVDHIDEDFTNDDIDNLQVLSNVDNARKYSRLRGIKKKYVVVVCPQCEIEVIKDHKIVRRNVKEGKAGPFCSKSCAGKYGADVKNGRALPFGLYVGLD